jgi:hypothetical protein
MFQRKLPCDIGVAGERISKIGGLRAILPARLPFYNRHGSQASYFASDTRPRDGFDHSIHIFIRHGGFLSQPGHGASPDTNAFAL